MVSLKEYIKEAKSEGYSKSEIRDKLIAAGYSSEVVDSALGGKKPAHTVLNVLIVLCLAVILFTGIYFYVLQEPEVEIDEHELMHEEDIDHEHEELPAVKLGDAGSPEDFELLIYNMTAYGHACTAATNDYEMTRLAGNAAGCGTLDPVEYGKECRESLDVWMYMNRLYTGDCAGYGNLAPTFVMSEGNEAMQTELFCTSVQTGNCEALSGGANTLCNALKSDDVTACQAIFEEQGDQGLCAMFIVANNNNCDALPYSVHKVMCEGMVKGDCKAAISDHADDLFNLFNSDLHKDKERCSEIKDGFLRNRCQTSGNPSQGVLDGFYKLNLGAIAR